MKYIIDGYNLLYASNIETREELVDNIDEFCRFNGKEAQIVFDGYNYEREDTVRVKVVYSGDEDQEIKDILNENSNPSAIILITSDRELAYVARQNKVKVIKAEDFDFFVPKFALVEKEDDPNLRISDQEVDELMNEFNKRKDLSS